MIEENSKIEEDTRDLQIIFMHVPKVGGTTMNRWFNAIYGRSNIYKDGGHVGPDRVDSPVNLDPDGYLDEFYTNGYPHLRGMVMVSGHFWIQKYKFIKNVKRITFLRHPIDRMLSEYWNIKILVEGLKSDVTSHLGPLVPLLNKCRSWNRKIRRQEDPFIAYCFEINPDLLQYARMPLKKYMYTKTYFGGVDPQIFDFIGDFANYDAEIQRLCGFLGIKNAPSMKNANVTSGKADGYREFKQGIINDPDIMAKLTDLLADDIAFYEKYAGKR